MALSGEVNTTPPNADASVPSGADTCKVFHAGPGITAFTFRVVSAFVLFFLSRVLGENGRLVCFIAITAIILQVGYFEWS